MKTFSTEHAEGAEKAVGSSSSVALTHDQIEAGASFGDLLRALRAERGWTVGDLVERVEGLLVKGRVRNLDLHGKIEAAEKAAACTLSPWLAGMVAGALVHTHGGRVMTMAQSVAWTDLVRGARVGVGA